METEAALINKVAAWAIDHGMTTGHADTMDSLLAEMSGSFPRAKTALSAEQDEIPKKIILPPDTQVIATCTEDGGVYSSCFAHVGIGDDCFSIGGDTGALRSLAHMLLHAIGDNCPECDQPPKAESHG